LTQRIQMVKPIVTFSACIF